MKMKNEMYFLAKIEEGYQSSPTLTSLRSKF